MLTAEELEDHFIYARKDYKKMEPCATHTVKIATLDLGQFAGRTALMISQTQVCIVLSPILMVEELVFSVIALAKVVTKILTVNSGACYGTLSVKKASTMLHAVSAVQTASLIKSILVFPAKS